MYKFTSGLPTITNSTQHVEAPGIASQGISGSSVWSSVNDPVARGVVSGGSGDIEIIDGFQVYSKYVIVTLFDDRNYKLLQEWQLELTQLSLQSTTFINVTPLTPPAKSKFQRNPTLLNLHFLRNLKHTQMFK